MTTRLCISCLFALILVHSSLSIVITRRPTVPTPKRPCLSDEPAFKGWLDKVWNTIPDARAIYCHETFACPMIPVCSVNLTYVPMQCCPTCPEPSSTPSRIVVPPKTTHHPNCTRPRPCPMIACGPESPTYWTPDGCCPVCSPGPILNPPAVDVAEN